MLEQYRTVYEGGEGEITEKKSRFIATVHPVESEEEALAFLEEMKKKYWDARHNCYVYSIGMNREFTRCSDDGEPSGTAGRPMLDVILGEEIYNVAVVVTRYFGGVLLGTGGLVRAYAKGAKMALDAAGTATFVPYTAFTTQVDYAGYEKVMHELAKYGVVCDGTEFAAEVTLKLRAKEENFARFKSFLADYTSGRSICTVIGSAFGKED